MREVLPPGKSVMRTNFVTPKSSGHESALTARRFGEQYGQRQRVWICESSRSTKNKAAVERRKRRKKTPSPVLYFIYRYFDCALQTPGRAFLNCPGIRRLNWSSETPDSLSPFWGKNLSTQPSSVAQLALVFQSFDKTCRTVTGRGREVFFYRYC